LGPKRSLEENPLSEQTALIAKPMEAEESVRWLLSFSNLNPGSLTAGRPGDLPNLLYDLRRYLQVEPGDEKVEEELTRAESDPRRLEETVRIVRNLLNSVADKIPFRYRYGAGELVFDANKLPSDSALTYHDASLPDAVVQVAVDDMSDASALRVKRCARAECRELFFAERRSQIYCGHRCANAIASRTYRKQEENRKRRRLHAKQKYREGRGEQGKQ
jgi:hypothetical protein